ncbi:hypothetical protein ACS0TY_013454 [Phlomoides rotata]
MQLNAYMIKVLQAQDDLVNSMREAASKELFHVSHHHHSYEHVLKDLIVQGSARSVQSTGAQATLFRFGDDQVGLLAGQWREQQVSGIRKPRKVVHATRSFRP